MQFQQLIRGVQTRLHTLGRANITGPIGIDFGIDHINLVQINRILDKFNITAAASIPYSVDREQLLQDSVLLKQLLKDTFKSQCFQYHHVVAALPPNLMQLVLVNYKCGRNQDHDTALIKAVSEQFNEKFEGTVIDYLPIRPKVEEQLERSALVAISKHEDVTQFLETLRIAGLKVKALEIGPVAIKRLLTNLEDHSESLHKVMAINFASINSFVTVLWGGELLLDRAVNIGLDCILETVSDALDISRKQAQQLMQTHGFSCAENTSEVLVNDFFNADIRSSLIQILKPIFIRFAKEIKKVLIYTAAETQGGAIDIVYILGSVARWPMVDQFLTNLINLPVKTINPFFGFHVDNPSIHINELEPVSGIAVATGLALHGFDNNNG